jgi:hypothetical protein
LGEILIRSTTSGKCPAKLCLAASTSAAFICFQNDEIIREPETSLARMLSQIRIGLTVTTKNGLRTAELSYGAALPEY